MVNTGGTGNSETFEELVEQTRGPRADIINGVRFYGGEAHTQQLRRYGDIPSGRYHFHKLEDQEIIEKVGEEHIGQGGAATVYSLTDFGHEIADALDGPSDATVTITELEERIDEMEKEIEILQQRYNAIADFVEEQDDEIDSLKQSHNEIADSVESLDERLRDANL
jgi:DNA-binding PadR family transcriptional regulator